MASESLASIGIPLAVIADLDPTHTVLAANWPALLRLHALLRRGLLVPEQFLLFNTALLRGSMNTSSRSELTEFLQNAPLLVSHNAGSQYATCEAHVSAAIEQDHPLLLNADVTSVRSYARFLDAAIPHVRRVLIDTPAAERTFPERFVSLAPHFGIPPIVASILTVLAACASERDGRKESRSTYDTWNRNDLYLVLNSDRFDNRLRRTSGVSPTLLREEPIKSTILACARAAYLSSLGDQLRHVDQDVLLWVPGSYDLSHSVLRWSKFESGNVRSLLETPRNYDLPIDALSTCSWRDLADYLRSDEPDTLAYFQARLLFLTAPPDKKLEQLQNVAVRLRQHLQRAAAKLTPRRAKKTTAQTRWHVRVDRKERFLRVAMTFAITGAVHLLSTSWIIGGAAHTLAEEVSEFARQVPRRKGTRSLASAMRASWYSSAVLADEPSCDC